MKKGYVLSYLWYRTKYSRQRQPEPSNKHIILSKIIIQTFRLLVLFLPQHTPSNYFRARWKTLFVFPSFAEILYVMPPLSNIWINNHWMWENSKNKQWRCDYFCKLKGSSEFFWTKYLNFDKQKWQAPLQLKVWKNLL